MQLILYIIMLASSLFALASALKDRNLISGTIAIGFIASLVFQYLSPNRLFYHAVALTVISASALIILILIAQNRFSVRQRLAVAAVAIPYILVCSFKVLQLQGVQMVVWSLLLSLIAFIFFTLERRIWDHYWAHLLYIAAASVLILIQ